MTAGESATIVAVATAAGKAGLAVVRLSGSDALAIARRLLPCGALAEPVTSHRARLAHPFIDLANCIGCGACAEACRKRCTCGESLL